MEIKKLLEDIRKLAENIKATTTDDVNISRANMIITYITRLGRYLGHEK